MMAWSSATLVLIGILVGPYGLNLLSASVLQLVDPIVAMALAMVGVFVGLTFNTRRARFDPAIALVVTGGLTVAGLRETTPVGLVVLILASAGIAGIVAVACWLLVRQADSEREQQVFAAGSLLLLGGAAAYLSLSALFAGFLAGVVWNIAGDLAKPRIVRDLDRFHHPLLVLMLLVAGASITMSFEALVLATILAFMQFLPERSGGGERASIGLVAAALALDVFRAAFT